jgi:hypothetical protein
MLGVWSECGGYTDAQVRIWLPVKSTVGNSWNRPGIEKFKMTVALVL